PRTLKTRRDDARAARLRHALRGSFMSQRRFAVSLALSAAIHVLPGLLLYFDVMGPGGGFGIGAGPGVGIGQGGGFGLGKGKKRQIFALQDVNAQPAPPRRGKIEERLSALTPPSAPE